MNLTERELTLLAESLTHLINSPEVSMYRRRDHQDFKRLRNRLDDLRWSRRLTEPIDRCYR